MCFTSAVFDQFQPYIPQPQEWPPFVPPVPAPVEIHEMRELIEAFRQAVAAAKTFDRLTHQPDCEDPDKARLLERVAELERRLDALEG